MLHNYDGVKLKILQRARKLFGAHGYTPVTITMLADGCGLTRRALYHHFRGKEEIFRAILIYANVEALAEADWAAQKAMARDASALEVVWEWLDARFGTTRRSLGRNPHGEDLNNTAFSLANDIMIEVSHETHARLGALLDQLAERGKLTLKSDFSVAHLAQVISDGARGVNQQRPPVPVAEFANRYRAITEAILFGCCKPN